jgi:myo-inositol 2-dehydrogenase/D-chiro-inositol 1-dehydrogenase
MEIVGSRDAVTVGLGQRTPLRSLEPDAPDLAGPAWQTFIARFEDAYREELLAFVGVASGEAASPCTARDALEAMRISVAAGRSCAEGRPIRVMDA